MVIAVGSNDEVYPIGRHDLEAWAHGITSNERGYQRRAMLTWKEYIIITIFAGKPGETTYMNMNSAMIM